MCLVSIIVPVYNSEDYIDRCLDSLINQTYKNIEILLIDDGSKDKSLEKMKLYVNKDKRVKVLKKENGGASSARNYGIDSSKGEYILFVDIDDYVELNIVGKMVNKINVDDCIVFSNNDEIYLDRVEYRALFSNIKDKSKIDKIFVMREIASGRAGLVCCKLIPKSILDKFNIRFDENIKMSEDQLFFLNVAQYLNYFYHVDEYLYHYDRTNDNSITMKYQDKAYENQMYVFNEIEKIFIQNEFSRDEDMELLSNRIKNSLWFCINNEIQTSNISNILFRCNRVNKIFLQSKIVEKYKLYIGNSQIDKFIITGVNSKNPTLITYILVFIIKGIIPLKNFMKFRLRRNYG